MFEQVSLMLLYAVLLILNYVGFKRIRKEEPEKWVEHEGNFYNRFLMRKIGLVPSLLFSFILFGVVAFLVPFPNLLLGFLLGVLSFNVIHDFYQITIFLDEIEKKRERRG